MTLEDSKLWPLFALATCVKVMLIPAYHSTDFEVHRNWLAITNSLPLNRWYYEDTSEWTLDYPPFFAYFEWLLSQVARFIDPQMLQVNNLNYASPATKYFQRASVMFMDLIFLWGVRRCLKQLKRIGLRIHEGSAEALLLLNIGLIFVDHIHFQYNGFLFGILLLSISYLLEERYLMCTLLFACLLNFKHIFLYTAPVFGIYLLRYYCLDAGKNFAWCVLKLLGVGLSPFVVSFGPFVRHLPQVLSRLFPFKRGLTHAYWAPNFWALYNGADKMASIALRIRPQEGSSPTSGLVQEFDHAVLPSIRPIVTFILTVVTMLPILFKLWRFTNKTHSKIVFLRSVVICSACSFMFGWHVHEKAILMCLIPLCLLFFVGPVDAKYAFMLSAVGHCSLFPLLFHPDLLVIRYSLFMAYMAFMYLQLVNFHKMYPSMHRLEDLYVYGLLLLPVYEHIISPLSGLSEKLPFMPLLLYSVYCGLGVSYCFIRYYVHALEPKLLKTIASDKQTKFKKDTSKDAKKSVSSPKGAKNETVPRKSKTSKSVKEKLK